MTKWWSACTASTVSSKSDAMDRLLVGVDAHESSVDSTWFVRGDDGADDGAESGYTLTCWEYDSLIRFADEDEWKPVCLVLNLGCECDLRRAEGPK
jgi:hypothetical protein